MEDRDAEEPQLETLQLSGESNELPLIMPRKFPVQYNRQSPSMRLKHNEPATSIIALTPCNTAHNASRLIIT